jgi:hypothetical protein
VPRDQFEVSFRGVVPDLTDLKLVSVRNGRRVQPTVQPIRNSDDLSLTSDRDSYRLGDTPVFTIVSPRDCFLTWLTLTSEARGPSCCRILSSGIISSGPVCPFSSRVQVRRSSSG